MQKFSNMPLSEVASAAVPAARRVAVPTAKPASLSAEALNIPRSGIRDVFDRVERVPDAISLTVGEPSATAAPHIVAAESNSKISFVFILFNCGFMLFFCFALVLVFMAGMLSGSVSCLQK